MNRLTRLILLVSLGLNVGLGWTALRGLRPAEPREPAAGRAWRERPAPEDTASWRRMMQRRVDRLSSLLDLEPAQATELERLQRANAPLVRAQRERLEAARRRVRQAADAGAYEADSVRGALAGVRRAQAEMDSLTQEFLLQEFAVLTAPQRARYLELLPLDPWRSGREGGHGNADRVPGRPGGRRHREE